MEFELASLPWSDFARLGALGALAGLLMGLFGIAGGTVLVPALLAVLTLFYGIEAGQAIRIAVATSLGCIVVSTVAKLLAQKRLGTLRAGVVAQMLAPVAAGVALAALASPHIPAQVLQRAFGVYLVLYLLYSLMRKADPLDDAHVRLPAQEARAVGLGIGFASGLLGIGGAFLSTPYLIHRGMSCKGANAAAPAVQLAVSIVGMLTYLCVPISAAAPGLVGSVAMPLVLVLGVPAAAVSLVAERWGNALSVATHKRAFEVFLLVVAVKLVVAS
jgi:uncharacterized membrane protein YfcA